VEIIISAVEAAKRYKAERGEVPEGFNHRPAGTVPGRDTRQEFKVSKNNAKIGV
jgi:hypothetical protein